MKPMLSRTLTVLSLLSLLVLASAQSALAELTAGDVDDNLNFDPWLRYMERQQNSSASLPRLSLGDRIVFRITDTAGAGMPYAKLSVSAVGGGAPVFEGYAGSDGVFYLFPSFDGVTAHQLAVTVHPSGDSSHSVSLRVDRDHLPSTHSFAVKFTEVAAVRPAVLDLLFVIDTTGSMGDELSYITKEFETIVGQVQKDHPATSVRFGLILYRDDRDDYVVRSFPFTTDGGVMQRQLAAQAASGGGDLPEAMDQAVAAALKAGWSQDGAAKVMILVADAPPHNEDLQATMDSLAAARKDGIHIYPLAASGVESTAQYMMRAAAGLSNGRYLFLTDDSGIGNSHSEPDIPCYVVTPLSDLLIRVVSGELAGTRVEPVNTTIIRKVGEYHDGICGQQGGGTVEPTPPAPVPSTGFESYPSRSGSSAGSAPADGGPPSVSTGVSKRGMVPYTPAPLVAAAVGLAALLLVRRARRTDP